MTLEDVYFCNKKTLNYKKRVNCFGCGGNGGESFWGGSGLGSCGNTGGSGTNGGGGGAACNNQPATSGRPGGQGGNGIVVVEEYK